MKTKLNRFAAKAIAAALATSCLCAPAFAKTDVSPYLQVDQVVTADLKNTKDVLTYTSVSAGIDATVSTNRAEVQINYQYQHNFSWEKGVGDSDVHTGLARARYELVPNTLNLEAGALATRARADIRGAAPGINSSLRQNNVTQVYSAYAGPAFSSNVGPVDVSAAYRFGYTKVEAKDNLDLPTGQQRLDQFDDSFSHNATASFGMSPGVLPFGWAVAGSYEREQTGQLSQRFESKGVRGDVVLPVTQSISLIGGVGYEDIQISQKNALVDATGAPVVDNRGRFQTDPASPRVLAYNQDGIYWDAGVEWRPSRRTSLTASVGRRYDSMSYTGSFSWQPSEETSIGFGVFDDVTTFGQQLGDNLSRLPTSFQSKGFGGLGNGFSGCVFGNGDTSGGCFNSAFQSINTASFRSRGAVGALSTRRGRWAYGVGGGYVRRSYLVPALGASANLAGVKDQSWFAQANLQRELSTNSSITADVYASLFDSGITGAPNVLSTGATGSYQRSFGRFSTTASVGLYSFEQKGFQSDLNASALVGARYQF